MRMWTKCLSWGSGQLSAPCSERTASLSKLELGLSMARFPCSSLCTQAPVHAGSASTPGARLKLGLCVSGDDVITCELTCPGALGRDVTEEAWREWLGADLEAKTSEMVEKCCSVVCQR